MNRRIVLLTLNRDTTHILGLFLCGILFLFGCIAGTIAAGSVSDGTSLNATVNQYLSDFAADTTMKPDLLNATVEAYKYHLAAIFLGFSILGVVCIPLLFAVRGFFLCFTTSTIIRLFGAKGILLTLSMFGISTMITVPCFFIISITAFNASLYVARQAISRTFKISAPPINRRTLVVCGICMIVLLLSALIDTYLSPYLISLAASRISF